MALSSEEKQLDPIVMSQTPSSHAEVEAQPRKRLPLSKRILAIVWDSLDKSPEERKLIAKLDWWILSYICVAYFVKYLDQTNVSNAYVSGMKEDLKMHGNDLNYLTTYWTIGYIIGQFPSQMVMTKVPPSIWLPACEILWSVFTIGIAGAKNLETVYALRFFVGLFEASAYCGIMTILGSWYTPAELGKRSCIFQASSSAAQMFSGYLQAALYAGMNGRGGLAAWQWLFVFDGIIGIPISIYGFFAIPDSPATCKSKWLNATERKMSVDRMEAIGRKPATKVTLQTFKDIFTAWPVYLFSIAFICHVLGIKIYSYFNVWLKSTKHWSTEEVNLIPTAGYGLQIFFTLSYAWASDALRVRSPIIVFACLIALIGCIILSAWPSHNLAAMMTGWFLTFCETGAGALFIAWINEVLGFSQEHRIIVIAVVETMAFTFQAWVPLLAYNTGQSPHFHVGYELAAMFFALEIVLVGIMVYAQRAGWRKGDQNMKSG